MTDDELRAKIRELMASGDLLSEAPSIEQRGSTVAPRIAVCNPFPPPCTVCLEPGPQITLFYVGGRVVRLHAACEALWQQERQVKPS